MDVKLTVQTVILLMATFLLLRSVMKLPKKVRIAMLVFIALQFIFLFVMVAYYPEKLVLWGSYIGVDIETE